MNRKCRVGEVLLGGILVACSVGGAVRGQSSDEGNPQWMKYGCCPMYYEDEYIRDYALECEESWRTDGAPDAPVAVCEDEFFEEPVMEEPAAAIAQEGEIMVDESGEDGGDYWYDGGTNQYHRYDLAEHEDESPFEPAEDDECPSGAESAEESYSAAEQSPDGGCWPQEDAVDVVEGGDSYPNLPEPASRELGESPARSEDALDDLFDLDRPLTEEPGMFGDGDQPAADETSAILAGEPEPAAPNPESLLTVARALDRMSYLLQDLSQHLIAVAEQELARAHGPSLGTVQR
jgi:hypothetical protein